MSADRVGHAVKVPRRSGTLLLHVWIGQIPGERCRTAVWCQGRQHPPR